MSGNIQDKIWDDIIDVIQNGAKESDLRDLYDEFMSERQYNNPDMKALFEHVLMIIDLGAPDCRSSRDEDKLIVQAIEDGVDQHLAYWVVGDKKLANSIEDDRVWRDIQNTARQWDAVEREYERGSRGRGRDDRGRGRDRDRDDRNTGLGYRQSRPTPERSDRGSRGGRTDRGNQRLVGGLGGSRGRTEEPERHAPRDRGDVSRRNAAPMGRTNRSDRTEYVEEVAVDVRDEIVEKNAGPDLSSARPFDSFWSDNELWELAHLSKLVWDWTPKNQYRRAYDSREEVCFLVKGQDGKVREEFLPMSEELTFTHHEIKANTRPNATAATVPSVRDSQEICMPGNDIDAVDLNRLNEQVTSARYQLIGELDVNNIKSDDDSVISSSIVDLAITATSRRLNEGTDGAAINGMLTQVLPCTGAAVTELTSIWDMIGDQGGLDVLHTRLAAMRGRVDESVLDTIDRHYTTQVNYALKYMFEFGPLNIDSFIGDFPALMQVVSEKRSASYAAHFLVRTRNLVNSMVIDSGSGACRDVIEAQDILPEHANDTPAYIAYRDNAIVMFNPTAMMSIKLDAIAFGVLTDTPRFPSESGEGSDPVMHDALNAMFLRARKLCATGRVYVMTADNILLELVASCGARDVVGIRRV
jgi:hypothetical protein